MKPSSPNVSIFDTAEKLAEAAAHKIVEIARTAFARSGSLSIALSGGNTPRLTYKLLATDGFRDCIPWQEANVFFVDERCVPHDHPDSNYGTIQKDLLSKVGVPSSNVHAIEGEGDPATNASRYENELRTFFSELQWPRFDLVLLGLGADGHTASLFPRTTALNETKHWVTENRVEKLSSARITLTAPAINYASNIIFLVSGDEKAECLAAVFKGPRDPENLPAQLIQPVNGSLIWLVDRPAASQLI